MKTIGFGIIALTLAFQTAALARNGGSAAKIAKLPPDKVAIIRRHCADQWPDQFDMRLYCEDKQYDALRTLIERGSE